MDQFTTASLFHSNRFCPDCIQILSGKFVPEGHMVAVAISEGASSSQLLSFGNLFIISGFIHL